MFKLFDHYLAGEKLYTKTVLPVCKKHGLTYMEFTVLMFLANNPQYDTASDIVKCKNLTKSHVSVSVHSLEQKGLLAGEYTVRNNKTVHLKVCADASGIVSEGRAAQQRFAALLLEGLSTKERAVMADLAKRIDANIQKYTRKGSVSSDAGQ